jgi:acetyl esterase/lipase
VRVDNIEKPDPKMAERIEYMKDFSPWLLVERQADYIRANVRIRLVCGDKDPGYAQNVAFMERLDSLKIPVSWVSIPDVAHDTKGLFDRVGVESLKFIHAALAQPGAN